MRESAPTKSTGGGGYTFADKIAAGFLVRMLDRSLPIEPARGPILALHFETRDAGNLLDDLSIDLAHGTNKSHCLISVKSNRQLTTSGFNAEFVQDAWEQWKQPSTASYNRDVDLLGLAVGTISDSAFEEWKGLSEQAQATTPDRLVERLANPGQMSEAHREIFAGLHDPTQTDALETARLASRIRVFPFSEGYESKFITFCSKIVSAGTLDEGKKLWDRLLVLAAENRGTGGFYDLPKLIDALRPDFVLHDYPDYEADWRRVEAVSKENADGIGRTLGGVVQLPRAAERAALTEALAQNNIVVLAAESGSGKSAVVATFVSDPQICTRFVWLSAEQLSKPSQMEIAHTFHLDHVLPELIRNSAVCGCILVLDRFEKFEGEARRRAIELVAAIKAESFIGWKIVFTCQDQFAKNVQDALIESGTADSHRIPFEKPSRQEIYDALGHLPQVRMLLLRTHLVPLLRNLVVLDWVLRSELDQRLSAAPAAWIGETDIINWIWERWIGNARSYISRDTLLRTLGRREGERLSGAVHVDTITGSVQLDLIATFREEGLLRVNLPSIRFHHDLMGDWARFRDLSYATDPVAEIKRVASIPRWARAIHLYAQSLAEKRDDLQAWKTASEHLAGNDPAAQVASDIFLDGVLFATNSEELLEEIWPNIIENEGLILKRLLTRLQHSASIPDPRFQMIDPTMAAHLEGYLRLPHPTYWAPALAVFERHSADVPKTALLPAAKACELYLRTMPVGIAGHVAASRLAIELAKELQGQIAEHVIFRDADKPICEALLHAAWDFPEEVAQIALELSRRRDEPEHAIQRNKAANEEREKRAREWRAKNPRPKRKPIPVPFPLSEPRGPLRDPADDGPREEISEGFRSAVMNTVALAALITVRPEAAREILLAVCIQEPKHVELYRDRSPFREDQGLAHWHDGYPAGYWKSAFLLFLQKAPSQALDAILRLVNYATLRSFEAHLGRVPTEEDRQEFGVELEANGRTSLWLGNAHQFAWHRANTLDAPAIECALMALEKWLYEEVEAGRRVSGPIATIFNQSESVAFAGVLIALGLKHPVLFTRDLQPLLGNLFLYGTQLSLALSEGNSWSIAYSDQHQLVIEMAKQWNQMPHRRYPLQEVAQWVMMQDEGTRAYLSSRIPGWRKLLSDHPSDKLELLILKLDPDSYKQTSLPDGQIQFELQIPPELENKLQPARTETDLKTLSLMLGVRARQCLPDHPLPPKDVPTFAADLERLIAWSPPDEDLQTRQYRLNSIAGAVAVLVIQHQPWLAEHPDLQAWCLDFLQNPHPSEGLDHDSPVSGLDHSAEAFRAEAGLALLECDREEWALRLVFDGITDFYYRTILQTMGNAFLRRVQLGEVFDELVNVVVLWSALRRAADRDSGYQADRSQLEKYKATLFRRLISGRLRGAMISPPRAERLARRLLERISRRTMSETERRIHNARQEHIRNQDIERGRRLRRETSPLDIEVLRKGFAFLPLMITDPLPADRERLPLFLQELFELEMRTLPRPTLEQDYAEIDGTPFDFDYWILSRVAEYVATTPSADAAKNFYRPILELGPAGRYWVEAFLKPFVSRGLAITNDLARFSARWAEIVEFALALPNWQPKPGFSWNPAEALAADLMGLSEVQSEVLGKAQYLSVVTAVQPVFERWAKVWLGSGSVAAWFCKFLLTESGSALLPWGIEQLADLLSCFEESDWQRYHLGDHLTDVLAACWKSRRSEIESRPSRQTAFLQLLTELCARQVPGALQLRTRVSEILAA